LRHISNQSLITDIYNTKDVFCISSLDDNFPNTGLESAACGIPVVGFKVGGVLEQVTDDCGILVEPKNSKALAEALETIITNEKIYKEYSSNCRKRVLENYSANKFQERYVTLYKKILK